jgi:hypothetical protein
MRYLNMTMILASTVMLTFACGDSGNTDGADDNATSTGTETTNEAGDGDGDGDTGDGDGDTGDGDGDGDTGDGDGDTGDGDGDTGDGDGDTGDGDGDTGDGDGEPGDGDGDTGCVPAGNTPCDECAAENCCDEVMACEQDQACGCLITCLSEGGGAACFQECGVDPNGPMNMALMQLRMCTNAECMDECAMP